ncbi:MAG: S49 family peptidase [Planctomycetota bacterium]|nr:S49 family peptidase [Planctomycetota bacterium]
MTQQGRRTGCTGFGFAACRAALAVALSAGAAMGAESAGGAASGQAAKIGWFAIDKPPQERPSPLAWITGSAPTLRDIVATLDEAASDNSLRGLVIQLKAPALSMTQVEELGGRIKAIRAEGKKVHVFAEQYGPAELVLGSYADEIIVQAGGVVTLPGLYMEEMFLADTLAWAGLKADMVQVGDYKGAAEQMTNSKPSPQWNENIDGLLDAMYGNLRSRLTSGRKLSDQELDAAMEKAWMADAGDAKSVGLVDSELDVSFLSEHLGKAYGGDVEWTDDLLEARATQGMTMDNPLSMLTRIMATDPSPEIQEPSIAVLHIDGSIVDGESSSGGLMGGQSVGSRTIREAIDDILDEDQIKGVVVRIDSPGGSAVASEIIWQGLRMLAETKPVWASVGSMAASGGYYIASGAERVYVNPSSIVGSIGVVGGKISMGGLYDTLKVNVVGRARGPRAAMFASNQTWSDAERELVRAKMKQTYDLFAKRVSDGRKGIDLNKVGEGRLFAGSSAIDLKMADALGGLEDAIAGLAASEKLDEYEVVHFPAPETLGDAIGQALDQFITAPGSVSGLSSGSSKGGPLGGLVWSIPAELVGPRVWPQVRQGIESFMLLRDEQVLLVMPSTFIWK